jgi:dienelactone hydrolase
MKDLLQRIVLLTTALFSFSATVNAQCEQGRFIDDLFDVKSNLNIKYGGNYKFDGTYQELFMNIYEPDGDTFSRRPLIMLAFGGSFTFGSRTSPDILKLCNAFAKKGYITATIDYRLGFENGNDSDTNQFKALMRAAQDMRAAIRFCYKDASTNNFYRIDTTQIFIGGVSAGGFTALNLAYGKTDTLSRVRPPYVDDALVQVGGIIGNSGNPGYSEKVRGVINLCGAIGDTVWLMPNDPILCGVHGTNDQLVPCYYDSAKAATSVEAQMFGSGDLNNRAQHINLPHSFYFFKGASHVPFVFNQAYMDTTIWTIRDFLAQFVVCGGWSGVQEPMLNQMFVSPNPFYQSFVVRFSDNASYGFSISDMLGKIILQGKLNANELIELPSNDNNLFFLSVEDDKGNRKIFKLFRAH